MIKHLEQHEAFLRAIFDAPDDETPKLVYADFLDEHGDPERAAYIRVGCDHRRLLAAPPDDPDGRRLAEFLARKDVVDRRFLHQTKARFHSAGRRDGRWLYAAEPDKPTDMVRLGAHELGSPGLVREWVASDFPFWYGATALSVTPAGQAGPDEVNALFDLPFTQQVTDWDLGGHVEEVAGGPDTEDAGTYGLVDLIERPVITLGGVEALAAHRGARRIRRLVLTHNRLGNDAVRALARSKHLIRLERLDLRDGNTPRGRVWQELVARYGEQVVG